MARCSTPIIQQKHLNLVALVEDFHVFVHILLLVVVAEGVLRRVWPRVLLGRGEGLVSVLVLTARVVVIRIVHVVPSVTVGLRVPVVLAVLLQVLQHLVPRATPRAAVATRASTQDQRAQQQVGATVSAACTATLAQSAYHQW